MTKVFVVGLECSGNKWIRSILSQCPDLEVTGDSFPSCMGADRHYPEPPDHYDVLVVVARDQNIQRLSVEVAGYNRETIGRFSEDDNLDRIMLLIYNAPKVVFVSYETTVLYYMAYLRTIFAQLGVEAPYLAPESQPMDGNAKYFAWRCENRVDSGGS